MSRYIDADALAQKVVTNGDVDFINKVTKLMIEAPSIDIVPRKVVKGYEGYYEVDMYGRVYSIERTITVNDNGRIYEKPVKARELTQFTHSAGYKKVCLTKNGDTKEFYVHRLVAEAYIPNPQNLPFINHKDEDKANNFVTNLEWCTAQYNNTYGDKNERQARKLRGRKQADEIIRKRAEGIKEHFKEYPKRTCYNCRMNEKMRCTLENGKHITMTPHHHYPTWCPLRGKPDDFCSYGSRSEKPNNSKD